MSNDPTPTSNGADVPLAATNLTLGYGGVDIVRDVALSIEHQTVTTIIGPNGCGKSTLLHGLARILSPQHGQVLLDGADIHQQSPSEVARRLGVLPQAPSAPAELTVAELVAQGRHPHRKLFSRWGAADADACDEALRVTGVDELRDRPLSTLSGGQRQRAWIAMAIAQQTGILLLDEPTTYLDLGYQLEVLDLIRSLNLERQLTVVMVLHDINQAAKYSHRLVVMKAGQIVAAGRPSDLVTDALMAEVFGVHATVLHGVDGDSPVCISHGPSRR